MPIIRSSTTAVAASGLPSELDDSSAVGRGHAEIPEAATAVVAPDNGHEGGRNMLSCI
jgi:hypothetical protein